MSLSSSPQENTALLPHTNEEKKISSKDRIAGWSVTAGVLIFAGLVASVLVRIPLSVFSYHPLFMTIFTVAATEGVSRLQPTETQEQKKQGLKIHAVIQGIGYTGALFGFTAIFYNKVLSHKPHFTSAHGQLGVLVFSLLWVQIAFGVTIAYTPTLVFGSVANAKRLWKYHRRFGYVLLGLVWLTAQLGVRADYTYNNLWSEHLIWLHWVGVSLVAGGLVARTRVSKMGF